MSANPAANMPSWAVVSTMDEPAPLVAAFVTYYLSIGASEVHLFIDNPDEETSNLLAGLPNCHVTLCDKAYWLNSRIGRRPKMHFGRQEFNANVAYARTNADWLLHVDADEFVRDGSGLQAELAAAPERAMYMRLLVAERVALADVPETDIFAGVFRMAFATLKEQGAAVYGSLNGFFRDGITGHSAGKSFVRTRAGLEMALHAPKGKQPHRVLQSTRVLHFDGLTRLHYMIKLLRRAHEPIGSASNRHGPSRVTQFESLREAVHDAEHREALVSVLKELQPEQATQLAALGLLDERPFDPTPALSAYDRRVDLSVATFDRYLRKRYGKFLRQVAPDLLDSPADKLE